MKLSTAVAFLSLTGVQAVKPKRISMKEYANNAHVEDKGTRPRELRGGNGGKKGGGKSGGGAACLFNYDNDNRGDNLVVFDGGVVAWTSSAREDENPGVCAENQCRGLFNAFVEGTECDDDDGCSTMVFEIAEPRISSIPTNIEVFCPDPFTSTELRGGGVELLECREFGGLNLGICNNFVFDADGAWTVVGVGCELEDESISCPESGVEDEFDVVPDPPLKFPAAGVGYSARIEVKCCPATPPASTGKSGKNGNGRRRK